MMEDIRDTVSKYKIIVVEGWDCVGKSFVIDNLSRSLGIPVFRPNYNYWTDHRLPQNLRWMIGASIFDMISSKCVHIENKLLIDRGILSGMVYTSPAVGIGYRDLLASFPKVNDGFRENYNVLHLIIGTDEQSFKKFNEMRGKPENFDYATVASKTQLFIDYARLLGLNYVKLMNTYNEDYASRVRDKCGSCGHYSYGVCRHPLTPGKTVNPFDARCSLSNDLEVQDQ